MSIFSGIKNRILKRRDGGDDDYGDIRSSVLNERPAPEGYNQYEAPAAEPPEPQFLRPKRFEDQQPQYDDKYRTPSQKRYEELTFDQPQSSGQMGQTVQQQEAKYDIMDRLNIIEAQLSAIRSQTETINERLKNIEMRLPRRY